MTGLTLSILAHAALGGVVLSVLVWTSGLLFVRTPELGVRRTLRAFTLGLALYSNQRYLLYALPRA